MSATSEMINDPREILTVNDEEGGMTVASIGLKGVTKIECYGETGEYGWIPFIKVWKGEEIAFRRPALKLTIYYAAETRAASGEGE